MKRRLAMLLAVAGLATAGTLVPSPPASADTDVCAGTGFATLSTGFGLPVVTVNTANFGFQLTTGACVTKPEGLFATGTVTGACGLSSGKGITHNLHRFKFTSTATKIVITGEVTGEVTAVEDPADAGSCTNKTATNFIIDGVVTKTHGGPEGTAPCKEKPFPEKDVC